MIAQVPGQREDGLHRRISVFNPLVHPLRGSARALLAAVLCLGAVQAAAVPGVPTSDLWLEAGNPRLRHDLMLLSDAGIVSMPVSTWPMGVANLAEALATVDPLTLRPPLRQAWERLRAHVGRTQGSWRLGLRVDGHVGDAHELRWFHATPRGDGGGVVGARVAHGRFSARLVAGAVADPEDDRRWRLDGSYAAAQVGNWAASVGALDRWWGPAWGGSTILGTNARPVPALAIDRIDNRPFQTPWLSWLGPWHLSAFMGQLESDRAVPRARLFGMRVTARPLPGLEIGLSRTAQWDGQDRPDDLDTFLDLLAGDDNQTGSGPEADADEPGNQLAGVDFRWATQVLDRPWAIYGQLIGEDEAGGLPSKQLGQAGLSTWGGIGATGASYRLFVEVSDTAAEFYKDEPSFGTAYNHGIYQSGYRYYQRSLGYPTDNDSQMVTLGWISSLSGGRGFTLLARTGRLNRNDDVNNTVSETDAELDEITATWFTSLAGGELQVGIGHSRLQPADDSADDETRGFIAWTLGY